MEKLNVASIISAANFLRVWSCKYYKLTKVGWFDSRSLLKLSYWSSWYGSRSKTPWISFTINGLIFLDRCEPHGKCTYVITKDPTKSSSRIIIV
jgi:hypothetical protein